MDSTLDSVKALPTPAVVRGGFVAQGAALLAAACVLGLIEASMPPLPIAPWLRLGLANIAVVVALAVCGPRTAAAVSFGRVAVVGLVTGTLFTPAFVMSAAGAIAAFGAMAAARALGPRLSPVGWSAAGSVAHVLGQFAAAAFVLGTGSIFVLAAPSALLALVFGISVGTLARLLVSRLSPG